MKAFRIALRFVVTVSYVVVQLILGLVTGTILNTSPPRALSELASSFNESVAQHEWWTVLTGLLVPRDLGEFFLGVILAILFLGLAEHLLGHWRVMLALIVTGISAIGVGLAIQSLGILWGDWWAIGSRGELTLDPLIMVCGAFFTATAFMSFPWRRRSRLWGFSLLCIFVLFSGDTVDTYRLLAAVSGLLLGMLLRRRPRNLSPRLMLSARRRRLFAALTIITSLGPLLTFFRPNGLAPLAVISGVFTGQSVTTTDIIKACATGFAATCEKSLLASSHHGVSATLVTFVPSILLGLAAWGISRGRRLGYILAIIVSISTSLVALATLNIWAAFGDTALDHWSNIQVAELTLLSITGVVLPLALATGLIIKRRLFDIRTSRRAIRIFAVSAAVAVSVLFSLTFITECLSNVGTDSDLSAGRVLSESLRPFMPFHLFGPRQHYGALTTTFSVVVTSWAPTIAWLVVFTGIIFALANPRELRESLRSEEAYQLLKKSSGTLGYWTTWSGNKHWISSDGEGAIAYRVTNSIALVLTDPICAAENRSVVVSEFSHFCEERHWTPAFYSVHRETMTALTRFGWSSIEVAQETLLDVRGFDLSSKAWQKIRHAVNRAQREEVVARWCAWSDLTRSEKAQIEAISRGWTAQKELSEMGFTLGGLTELRGPDVMLMIAVDVRGRIQGVTSWLPVFEDDLIVGRTLDFMRRARHSFNGAMEFIIGSAAIRFQEDGLRVVSLSGVPLAKNPQNPKTGSSLMDGVLNIIARRLEPLYGFTSLFVYKSKFNPSYQPLFLVFPDSALLGQIGLAIARAYLPGISWRNAGQLTRIVFPRK